MDDEASGVLAEIIWFLLRWIFVIVVLYYGCDGLERLSQVEEDISEMSDAVGNVPTVLSPGEIEAICAHREQANSVIRRHGDAVGYVEYYRDVMPSRPPL